MENINIFDTNSYCLAAIYIFFLSRNTSEIQKQLYSVTIITEKLPAIFSATTWTLIQTQYVNGLDDWKVVSVYYLSFYFCRDRRTGGASY